MPRAMSFCQGAPVARAIWTQLSSSIHIAQAIDCGRMPSRLRTPICDVHLTGAANRPEGAPTALRRSIRIDREWIWRRVTSSGSPACTDAMMRSTRSTGRSTTATLTTARMGGK